MAWGHAGHFIQDMVNASTGVPLASTSYQVFQSDGTTLASIYSDRLRTSPVTQPLTTSSSGNAEFFTDPQDIIISISGQSIHETVYPDVADLGALLTAASLVTSNDFGTNVVTDYLNTEYTKTGGYTFVATDSGSTVTYNAGSSGSFTLPNNLPVGWNVAWRQKGAGQIIFSPGSGATLENANSHTKSRTAGARGGLEVVENSGGSSAIYSLYGDTST